MADVRRPERGVRRMTLLDVMILVAVMACGIALVRASRFDATIFHNPAETGNRWFVVDVPKTAGHWIYGLLLALAPVTLAVLLIRLRRPRPGLRRLCRQPGLAGSAASAVGLLLALTRMVLILNFRGQPSALSFSNEWYEVTACTAGAVTGSWFLLWLSGRWRPEPSAIDRLGRALGVLWIAGPIVANLISVL